MAEDCFDDEDMSLADRGSFDEEQQLLQVRAQHTEEAQAAFALQTTKSWHEARYWLVCCSVTAAWVLHACFTRTYNNLWQWPKHAMQASVTISV